MADFPTLINGKSYAWAEVTVLALGVPIAGVKAISYTRKQEKKNNYGAGSKPVSRGHGREEYEASITLSMNEIQTLTNAAPQRNILKIPPFDIIVSFLPTDGIIVTHKLRNAEFLEDPIEMEEGDAEIVAECPLIISDIEK
jgi:hypothetical protein